MIGGISTMSSEIIEALRKSIREYDKEAAEELAGQIVARKMDPVQVIDELIDVISSIGEAFSREELFLPDLIGAADAMQGAMPILEEEIGKRGVERKKRGTVVIGTVFGDVHNIGKDMVGTLLMAEGFEIFDLGVNVHADMFIDAVSEHRADILAMSSLLTTTALEQRKVIEALKKSGLRDMVKVMVGGGAITDEFAEDIGADGYEPTAADAVMLAKKLVDRK
jgi:corrinoid protein of di/trimethylamine methyltransferase